MVVTFLNRVFASALQEDELDFLQDRTVRIHVQDMQLNLCISLQQGRLREYCCNASVIRLSTSHFLEHQSGASRIFFDAVAVTWWKMTSGGVYRIRSVAMSMYSSSSSGCYSPRRHSLANCVPLTTCSGCSFSPSTPSFSTRFRVISQCFFVSPGRPMMRCVQTCRPRLRAARSAVYIQ